MIAQTRTRYHTKFYYFVNDEMICSSLQIYGEYQQLELEFLLSILTPDSVVYDVGANVGYHTTAFASCAQQVISFEPNPQNFALLEQNTRDLERVTVYQAAVSNNQGPGYIGTFDPAVYGNFGHMTMNAQGSGVQVPCMTLDSVNHSPPDLIKIDVEGHEYEVLQGGVHLLKSRRPVIYYEAIETPNLGDIYRMLTALDYRLYWVCIRNYNPNNFLGEQENIYLDSALMSIVAWPGHYAPLPLDPVQGADDRPQRFYVDGKI
jgi:FkbM family methyltransferase